ncbi:hypothetical protein [Amycolatopsis magusensis]|uniref:hypothetical protein n=1 Tax=Amycolatopsis magusensis TaxID=882444 RepID=UPI0037BA1105
MGDLGQLLGWQLDGDGRLIAFAAQVHGQLNDVEELPEQVMWRLSQVEREVGQLVEQAGVGRAGALVLVLGGLERGECVPAGGLLFFKLVVGLAEAPGERIVGVAGPGLPENGPLLAVRVGDQPFQPLPLGLALAGGAVVHGAEVSNQDVRTA